jgi:hypothetical protein
MAYGRNKGHGDAVPFNNTFGKLERINMWWEKAGEAKLEENTRWRYNALENIFIEVSPFLVSEELSSVRPKLKQIERFLDRKNVPAHLQALNSLNERRGDNLLDELSIELAAYCHKYKLEWLDIVQWRKTQKDSEQMMRG